MKIRATRKICNAILGRSALLLATVGTLAFDTSAWADVKQGVDRWSAGDFAGAVKEWQAPADQGDADAQFNLAQAYRLGRGVAQDNDKALALYAAAAASGHPQAADHYGLMLFQGGRREEALPYVEVAAARGDPRAQYLLGIAHFNGDLVAKDWVRAYALLTMANSASLPQAVPAIAQMDEFIPMDQRQQGAGLAANLQKEAEATRARQLAAAELSQGVGSSSANVSEGVPAMAQAVPAPSPSTSVADATMKASSVAAAKTAVADAMRATGTETPAAAGADYTRPNAALASVARPAPKPTPQAISKPAAKPVLPASAPAAKPVSPWQVQLGAFSVAGSAERLWAQLSNHSVLAGKTRIVRPAGRLTKLLASGFASKAEADSACVALKRAGQGCLVTR